MANKEIPVEYACAPLALIRLVGLPRRREHAVTAGWLAGLHAPVMGASNLVWRNSSRQGLQLSAKARYGDN